MDAPMAYHEEYPYYDPHDTDEDEYPSNANITINVTNGIAEITASMTTVTIVETDANVAADPGSVSIELIDDNAIVENVNADEVDANETATPWYAVPIPDFKNPNVDWDSDDVDFDEPFALHPRIDVFSKKAQKYLRKLTPDEVRETLLAATIMPANQPTDTLLRSYEYLQQWYDGGDEEKPKDFVDIFPARASKVQVSKYDPACVEESTPASDEIDTNNKLLREADAWLHEHAKQFHAKNSSAPAITADAYALPIARDVPLEADAYELAEAIEIPAEAEAYEIPVAESVSSSKSTWYYAVGKGIKPGVYRTSKDAN